jgi:hypothetical protein
LVGGVDYGRYIIEPKWLVGYDKVADYFNSKEDPQNISVAIADYDYLKPFAKFQVLNIKHKVERDTADYFVLPAYRKERNRFYEDSYILEKKDIITVAGVDYYYIYKRITLIPQL